jgi:lipoprotein-anchoring transpeptidase ErfK/SrfK
MRRHCERALVAAVLACATASAASANPVASLFGNIFGGPAVGPAHAPYYEPIAAPAGREASRPAPVRIPRESVAYHGPHAPGTVIVNTSERRLYLVLPGQRALRYGIGVGRAGFEWSGVQKISRKLEWPDWRPPEEMIRRRPDLPRYMAGGPDNPLGARAMYLGDSLYRIHGSNEPETIGQAVSSGCIRMLNEDVIDLYERVKVGTTVVVLR